MSNLLKAEFYKLLHSLYFWGITLFNLLLSSLLLLDSVNRTPDLFSASLYNTPSLYFMTIVFAALFVGDDFGGRTLHSYISAGHKRSHVLFAKALVCQTACMLMFALPLFVHGLIGLFCFNETFLISTAVTTAVMAAISILAMCMLPFFFSFTFREMGKALAVSMVLFFLMILLLNSDQSLYFSMLLPMGQLRLFSLHQLPLPGIYFIAADFIWISVLYSGAYISFRSSDLK